MVNKIEELECKIFVLERMLEDPWRILLDDVVREYIRKNYPHCDSYDNGWLYDTVLGEMKDKIRRILMGDDC